MTFAPLPPGPFDVVIADPPWSYTNGGAKLDGLASSQYATVSTSELCELPVAECVGPCAVLVMWATWPKLEDAFRLIKAWGFEYKTGLPWVKTYGGPKSLQAVLPLSERERNGRGPLRPVLGVGFWFRGASEPILIATRGKVKAPPRVTDAGSRIGLLGDDDDPLVLAAPRGRHSAKPPDIYDYAEEITDHLRWELPPTRERPMTPRAPRRLELFARATREGWRAWGNQAPEVGQGAIELPAPMSPPPPMRCARCDTAGIQTRWTSKYVFCPVHGTTLQDAGPLLADEILEGLA